MEVAGPSVFPSGEPGVSGDFWGSQEGCQGPSRLTYSLSYLEPVCCSMSSSNCCFLTCIQISHESGSLPWPQAHQEPRQFLTFALGGRGHP